MSAALAATAQPEHPLSTFSWGASRGVWKAPLEQSISARDTILQHLELYSASLTNLVVLGGESLDVLEQYVTEYFGMVCIFTAFVASTLLNFSGLCLPMCLAPGKIQLLQSAHALPRVQDACCCICSSSLSSQWQRLRLYGVKHDASRWVAPTPQCFVEVFG
jgi:hypothetical protein